MSPTPRWDRCISHKGVKAQEFVSKYFGETGRQLLVIAGAGFDPRATVLCDQLGAVCKGASAILIREIRPQPPQSLLDRADANLAVAQSRYGTVKVLDIEVFAADGAITGGRQIVRELEPLIDDKVTDIVVDMSALSVGIGYPAIKLLLRFAENRKPAVNLHVVMVDAQVTDGAIHPVYSDRASSIHGFQHDFGLDSSARAAKLWLPQLGEGKNVALGRIHQFVNPDEVCPILPFPASDPRLPDRLVESFGNELTSNWQVDLRNLVYAAERNPVDLYRAILRISDARKRVFDAVGGSLLVISPLGSKAISVGALMAAVERRFPLVYVEAVSYDVSQGALDASTSADAELVHVWLVGDAYGQRVAHSGSSIPNSALKAVN